MWKRILAAWSLYRHGAALRDLLRSLGIWGYITTAGAGMIGTLVAQWASLPIWGQILVGLGAFALVLLCVGLSVAVKRVAADPGTAIPSTLVQLNAPTLWVDYKPKGTTALEAESLIFRKEGPHIKTIQPGPLIWTVRELRPINLLSVIGPLRTEPVECKFTAFEQRGDTQMLKELPELLREMMGKFGNDVHPSIEIYYEDYGGNWFYRTFILLIDPWGKIVWEPGPVQSCAPPNVVSPS